MQNMKVRLTFTEDILGSASGNPDLHREFIASKAPDADTLEDEVAALGVDEVEKKEMTVFHRDDKGNPILFDYQIRGFFKSACYALNQATDSTYKKLTAYKKKIDLLVFVDERKIPIKYDGEIGVFQRPLRGQTAQGERIALASSERIHAGATVEFGITSLDDELMEYVCRWLDYGRFNGLGQYRNGSFGRFVWEDITNEKKSKKIKK